MVCLQRPPAAAQAITAHRWLREEDSPSLKDDLLHFLNRRKPKGVPPPPPPLPPFLLPHPLPPSLPTDRERGCQPRFDAPQPPSHRSPLLHPHVCARVRCGSAALMCVGVQVDDFTDVRLVIEARPCHSCTGTGLIPAASVPGLGSPLPLLYRNWAHPCHICTGTRTAATSAPGLGSPLPHLHRDSGDGQLPAAVAVAQLAGRHDGSHAVRAARASQTAAPSSHSAHASPGLTFIWRRWSLSRRLPCGPDGTQAARRSASLFVWLSLCLAGHRRNMCDGILLWPADHEATPSPTAALPSPCTDRTLPLHIQARAHTNPMPSQCRARALYITCMRTHPLATHLRSTAHGRAQRARARIHA